MIVWRATDGTRDQHNQNRMLTALIVLIALGVLIAGVSDIQPWLFFFFSL